MIYLIGNPTRDTISARNAVVETFGGTVWYAALLMVRLLQPVAVVGCGDSEIKRRLAQQGVDVRYFSDKGPVTHFENIYASGKRRQYAWSGPRLHVSDMPPEVFEAPAILAGPVLQEIDPAILTTRRKGRVLLDAQGFLRCLTGENLVIQRMGPNAETAIRHCDILKVDTQEARNLTSTGDIDTALQRMYRMGPKMTIITQGAKGARLYDGARFIQLTAPKVSVVDTTGAGDVFAAAFLVRYLECSDAITAGRFAVAAAALSTRGFGATALPSGSEIDQMVEKHFLDPGTVTVRNHDSHRK